MEAGASGGAPVRAGRARRRARYGIRWRARQAGYALDAWLMPQGLWEMGGMAACGAGLALLLASCAVRWAPWWAYLEFGALCATGITARQVARHRRRRR